MKKRLFLFIGLTLTVLFLSAITVSSAAYSMQAPSLEIVSNTLELQNAVFMNFKVDVQNIDDKQSVDLLVWESAPEEYTKDTAELTLSSIRTEQNTGYLVFQYDDLAAKDMTKFIYVCAYAECNGDAIYSKPVKFSILQYAYNMLNSGTANEYLEGILTNMLEYGAFSQLYFNHNADFLATDEVAKIKVVNGTHADGFKTGYYKAGTSVTLIADEAADGYKFSHWEDSSGKIIGTNNTLVITAYCSETYTATYGTPVAYSEGLVFVSNGNETCYVSGIGTCTDTCIIIPPFSPDGYSVTGIGHKAFYNCSNIISVTIPNSVTSIDSYAFFGCSNLTSIRIPNHVTSIGGSTFSNCNNLTNVTIPNSVTNIGAYAFKNCDNLQFNEYDNGYYLGNDENPYLAIAKAKDISISSCVIHDNTKFILSQTFENCNNLTSIEIPNGVTSIGDSAFDGCSSLWNIEISNSVTSIGGSAFYGCSSLTSVEIPNSVTSIGAQCFAYCSKLSNITIPDSVTSLGDNVFHYCHYLNYSEYDNGYYLGNKENPYLVFVKAKNTSISSCSIYENTRFIASSAFEKCKYLTDITIPDSVIGINCFAFDECKNLTNVTISNNVTSIGLGAFQYCSGLTNVTIPNSVTYIDSYVFSYCNSLVSITIPDGIARIGYEAFYGCNNLISVVIPNSVTRIDDYAFSQCGKLTKVMFENPNGWWYSSSSNATNGNIISSTNLSDVYTAARYLASTYDDYYWFRD